MIDDYYYPMVLNRRTATMLSDSLRSGRMALLNCYHFPYNSLKGFSNNLYPWNL